NRTQFQSYFLEQYRNQATIIEPTAVDKHAVMAAFGKRTFASTMDAVLRRNFELFGATTYRYVFKHFNKAMIGEGNQTSQFPFISFATHSFDQRYALGFAYITITHSLAMINWSSISTPQPSPISPRLVTRTAPVRRPCRLNVRRRRPLIHLSITSSRQLPTWMLNFSMADPISITFSTRMLALLSLF
ncbi:hypothetical protein PENTCL1PPCAC_11057, partial [Pristionchus entomophagus]